MIKIMIKKLGISSLILNHIELPSIQSKKSLRFKPWNYSYCRFYIYFN